MSWPRSDLLSVSIFLPYIKHPSGTIFANNVSATITCLVMSWSFGLTKNDVTGLLREARSSCWYCDVAAWRIASYFPPAATLKCELHTRQFACENPLSLRLIQCRSPTHSWMNLDAYFFFEFERDDGFKFAGAILHIDECQASARGTCLSTSRIQTLW